MVQNTPEFIASLEKLKTNLFPFTVRDVHDNRWWRDWHALNREWLIRDYGWSVYTGCKENGGYQRIWSFYELDLQIKSETDAVLMIYGMRDSFSGGRGLLDREIPITVAPGDFKAMIRGRSTRLIQTAWKTEEERQRRQRIRDEQNALHMHVFGHQMEDS